MSGGETHGEPQVKNDAEPEAEKDSLSGYEDVVEGLSEENEVDEDEAALNSKGSDDAGPETVLDKSQKG